MEIDSLALMCLQRRLADFIARKVPLDKIRILLAQGAKVNHTVTNEGLHPLHYAVCENYAECVELLITRGADFNTIDEIGYTPLHLAAEEGYLDILKILVKAGANVNFNNDPNIMSLDEEPLRLTIKAGHYACAEFLLQNGANANLLYFLGSELSLTACMPDSAKFVELLLKYGAKTECRDRSGLTPIMRVAKQRNGYQATKYLLKYGAEVNCYAPEDQDFRSVLHYAVISSNISILRLLLFCGANVAYPSEILKKPSTLDFAILKGNLKMIEMLIEFGAQLNTGSPVIGLPLHIVLSEKIKNRKEILIQLLENGADPNLITIDNRGPLLKPPLGEYFNNSSEKPDLNLVRLLLKYNARVICTAQVQHPLGILKILNKLEIPNSVNELDEQIDQEQSDQPVNENKQTILFHLLMNACELFNIESIQRCRLLSSIQKQSILRYAKNPLRLKNLARLSLRKSIFNFAKLFFDDEQNATSIAYTNKSHLFKENKLFNHNNHNNLDTSNHNEGNTELTDFNDSLQGIRDKDAYKKYVGNRYQRCVNTIESKLFIKQDSSSKLVFNKSFAISCGLTTEELEIVKLRYERENKLPKNTCFDLFSELTEEQRSHFDNCVSSRNQARLPIGFRFPSGYEWPIRLIELNCKYNNYNSKYNHSSKYSEEISINELKEKFNFDEINFKCSSSFAIYLIENLPIPLYLRKFVLYEED